MWSCCSYEKAETHRTEVPRMLLEDPAQLEDYVLKSKDKCEQHTHTPYMHAHTTTLTSLV